MLDAFLSIQGCSGGADEGPLLALKKRARGQLKTWAMRPKDDLQPLSRSQSFDCERWRID